MTETRMHANLRSLAAWAVAAVFIYAAAFKIHDPAGFVADIRNYRLMPWWSLNAIALVMPWWEMLAALALIVPTWRRAGAILTGLMGVLFFVSVSQALIRGLDIHCGCFGHGEKAAQAGLQTLLIDVGIIIASWYVLLGKSRTRPAAFEVAPVETAAAH